ncbi:hypothetical protein [Coleofasciculus chthonoplastes]
MLRLYTANPFPYSIPFSDFLARLACLPNARNPKISQATRIPLVQRGKNT